MASKQQPSARVFQQMRSCAKAAETAPKKGLGAASLELKKGALSQMRTNVPSLKLRNMRNAKLNARYDIKGTTNPTSLVRATGPWQIIENDTSKHGIKPRKRRGKKALTIPTGTGFAARVNHPGTKGRHPWEKGTKRALPKATQELRKPITNAIKSAFLQ